MESQILLRALQFRRLLLHHFLVSALRHTGKDLHVMFRSKEFFLAHDHRLHDISILELPMDRLYVGMYAVVLIMMGVAQGDGEADETKALC
jgi:hypothetical protein